MGINPRNLHLRPKQGPFGNAIATVLTTSGILFGMYLDLQERNRYLFYRDKSLMFGKEKKEGEPPSWGSAKGYWDLDKWETFMRK